MKRRSKILIGVVLAVVIGWPLLLMISHKNVRDKVAAYKRELRAKGEKLTFAELAPPRSTKTPNGAKALTNVVNYSTPTNYPRMMTMIAPGVARIGHTNLGVELMFNYTSNVKKTAELRAILNNAAVLDFGLDYPHTIDLPVSHLTKLKAAEVVVSATAMQALSQKEYSEAWPDMCAAIDLVRLHDNEPLAISQLVRYAMTKIAIALTWEALQENEWTDAQLSELQAKWETTDMLDSLEPFMSMERAYVVEALALARKSREAVFLPVTFSGPNGGSWLDNLRQTLKDVYERYPRYWIWKSSWSYEQEHYLIQIGTAAVKATRNIKAADTLIPALTEFRREATNINEMYPNADEHFILWDTEYYHIYEKYIVNLADAETARRLLVTVLALKRHRLQHDAYPAGLNELVPKYLKQLPLDFMDGKPLRYHLRPDGDFLLYSVGEDGEDNGGDPSPGIAGKFGNWLTARDIVWPRAATAAEIEKYEGHSGTETNAPAK